MASEALKTKLGSQGLEVSKIGFGCMGITTFYGAPMEDAAALELLKNPRARPSSTKPSWVRHRMPKTQEQLKEWMQSAGALVKAGKIRYVGLSEVSPAHEVFPVTAVQQEWSLLTRTPIEDVLVPVCVELGVGVVAYSPLARNLLSEQKETPKDIRSTLPRYSPENFQKNQELTAKIAELGKNRNATASELSLAWLYHRAAKLGAAMCAIPGTTKIGNAMSNIRAPHILLSDDEANTLEELGALAVGDRASAELRKQAMESQLDDASKEYCSSLRCANYAPCPLHP